MKAKAIVERLAKEIGVTINGPAPDDPQIYDDVVYKHFLSRNSLAVGESFVAKQWDCEDLAGFFTKVLRAKLYVKKTIISDPKLFLNSIFFNLQNGFRAYEVGKMHYDLGNDLFQATLGKHLLYTCDIWAEAQNLDDAQERKMERICRQLKLKPGQRVLDIGCGWGGFMKYAAQKYQVSCVGLSVSTEQTAFGKECCQGLPIEFVVIDYQKYQPDQPFDHIVSIEMIEAVGLKNLRTYFKKVHEWLKPRGTFLLQAIGDKNPIPVADPWIDKYIFRNGVLVSLHQLEKHTRDLFSWCDLKDIGIDYDPTLMAWWGNFSKNYDSLKEGNPKYDEHFYRMWKYYLQSCAALFRTKTSYDWQILLEKMD